MALTFGNDERFEPAFLVRSLHDGIFDSMGCDQAENKDGPGLTDAMCAVLRLHVHLGILASCFRLQARCSEA